MKRLWIALYVVLLATNGGAQEVKTDSLSTDDVQLDSIFRTLPEVMITGERPAVRAEPGKLVYDVPRLIVNKPVDNIYEALKELPGVVEQNESITLGGLGVTIVLDGKVTNMNTSQLMALLKTMPAKRIKHVEVMYSAPAKYQVRGAMINVVLNRDADNLSRLQGEVYGLLKQRHHTAYEERTSLQYNRKKFSVDLLYDHSHGTFYHIGDEQSLHTLRDGTRHEMNTTAYTHAPSQEHAFRMGADYRFTENHQLSLVYNGNYSSYHNNQTVEGAVRSASHKDFTHWLHNLRLDYETPFGLKAGVEFTYYKSPEKQLFDSEYGGKAYHFESNSDQKIDRWKFFLSQEHRLKSEWGLNYGVIYDTSVDHSYQYYVKTSEQSADLPDDSSFRQAEDNINLYAGGSKRFGKKLMLDASLAAEYYHSIVWNRWDWYPVFNLTYLPKDGHTLQLSLSSNKTYPEYWAVHSFVSYNKGGYGAIVGNPFLKPSSDYRLQSVYVLKNKYTFIAWYDYQKDKFTQLAYQRPDRLLMEYKYCNFDYTEQIGFQASVPVKIAKWWQTHFTLIGVWQRDKDSDFYDIPFDRDILWTMGMVRNTLVLSSKPDLSLTVNGMIRSKAIQGNYNLPESHNLDIAFRYKFMNNRATVRLYGTNILESNAIYPTIRWANQRYRMHYSDFRETGVSFTYAFGGYKAKSRADVDTSRFK